MLKRPIATVNGASGMSVMANWAANHGAVSYGHIDAGLISLASILGIPLCKNNVDEDRIFRPGTGNSYGEDKEGSDYRAREIFVS